MASNNITLLRDIRGYRRNAAVKVKVASLWKVRMNGTEDQTFRVDMILMDEQGNFIYCTCFHKLLKDFERFLKIDNTLLITNPGVTKDDNPRYVTHEHKLSLSGKTSVSTCNDWEGLKFAFNFADFKDVLADKYKDKAFIDFIGYVQVCNELGMVTKRNGVDSPKINFKLRDLAGIEIHASLWEHNAVILSNFMNDKNRDPHVFIIVQFGAVNKYQGNIGVTNRYDAARIFINADVAEMESFKQKYVEKFFNNESSGSSITNSGSLVISSVEEEFLHKCGFILTRYISSIRKAKKVIIVGTITEISNEMQWYYRGCNYCKSKVEKKYQSYEREYGVEAIREVWECTGKSCPGLEVHEVIRFRILLKVQDCSSITTLTLFDSDAKKIFGKTAQQLVDEELELLNNGQIPPAYPKEFDKIIGQKYAFVIKVTDYNIAHQLEQYSISMLTQDEEIMAALQTKFGIQRLEERYSDEGNDFSDLESTNEEITRADAIDPVEDNADDEDVYEIHGPIPSRESKRQKLNATHVEVATDKVNLLTPKIEKD